MNRLLEIHCLAATILFLSACAVGPDYVKPTAPVSPKFKEMKNKDWKVAQPRDHFDHGAWWKLFHDPVLSHLEDQLNANNQTIKNALANYTQAEALVDEARANFYPTFSGTVTATRQRTVSGSTAFAGSTSTGASSTGTVVQSNPIGSRTHVATVHSVLFSASWEPDFWGLVRRQVEASKAGAEASSALLAATRLSAQTSLATYYFQLRGLDTDKQLLNSAVRNYRKTLALTMNQYRSGVASRADVVSAQAQLESAQAQAISIGVLRAQYEHAIAVLTGVPPAMLSINQNVKRVAPPTIPVMLPSALLERRPDIAQAERLMQQANANIGVAIAAYFPSIDLLGTASVAGTGLSHWFSLPMMAWSYGPQITQLIYDGGLRSAQVRAARAGYDATIATYRQTVLAAFQEVEDNVSNLRILRQQYLAEEKAAASARTALQLVINQYRAGTVPYSSVLTAQTNAYTAEQAAADVNYQRMTSAVTLISALGGGWDSSRIDEA